jgi:hypothetical protein
MAATLKFLTASPARREAFAEGPQNFAGRPEEDERVPRALIGGIVAVMAIYCSANLTYFYALPGGPRWRMMTR